MSSSKLSLRRAEDLLRAGSTLVQMNTKHGLVWFAVPGAELQDGVGEKLLERPDVQPSNEGLFPGISQTYRMRKAS